MKVFEFLQDKEITFHQKGDSFIVSCFNKAGHGNNDATPSLSVDIEKGFFHCWGCKVRGHFGHLIGAMGYVSDIMLYTDFKNTQGMRFDISFLLSDSSVLDIPGFGKFIDKNKEELDAELIYIKSRKFKNDTKLSHFNSKEDYINAVEDGFIDELKVPDNYTRLHSDSYFIERGLPSTFLSIFTIYREEKNRKYFHIPIYGAFGRLHDIQAVAYSRDISPRTYWKFKRNNQILGIEDLDLDRDIYVVEGWLDYYKLKVLGYNVIALLSNNFNSFHYNILSKARKNVFFVFDQDAGGFMLLKTLFKFVSRFEINWFAINLNRRLYKDVGDIELLQVVNVLQSSLHVPIVNLKKYWFILAQEKFNESSKDIDFDRHTFRRDEVFSEFGTEHIGRGSKKTVEVGVAIGQGTRDEDKPLHLR